MSERNITYNIFTIKFTAYRSLISHCSIYYKFCPNKAMTRIIINALYDIRIEDVEFENCVVDVVGGDVGDSVGMFCCNDGIFSLIYISIR